MTEWETVEIPPLGLRLFVVVVCGAAAVAVSGESVRGLQAREWKWACLVVLGGVCTKFCRHGRYSVGCGFSAGFTGTWFG